MHPYGEYICIAFYLILQYCTDGSIMVINDRNMSLFLNKKRYRIFSNLIRTSFWRFLKRKKKLVRGSNPHLSFNRHLGAAPSEVARWVSAAWKAIPESIIFRSFKKGCKSNALDGSEDDILWEDDGEDKDDSDWVTYNISFFLIPSIPLCYDDYLY